MHRRYLAPNFCARERLWCRLTIGCFVNVRKKLLTFHMKNRNLINRAGFSRISSQLAIYPIRRSGKLEMLRKLYPHEGREYLTTISDSLSCAVVISWLNSSIKIIVTIWVPLTAVPTKNDAHTTYGKSLIEQLYPRTCLFCVESATPFENCYARNTWKLVYAS